MILVCSANQQPEKRIKLLPTVSVYCATNGPHYGEDKQALKPVGDLKRNKKNVESNKKDTLTFMI